MFRLGYNTNGLAHNRLSDALVLLADLGYQAVALTPDVGHLDPFTSGSAERRAVREQAEELGLELVVETGARYLLHPTRKHFPTLLEEDPADRARRARFLMLCTDLAAELGSGVVSIWSGAAPGGQTAAEPEETTARIWDRLAEGLEPVLAHATERSVCIALEPEPGMFIERPAEYLQLLQHLGAAGGSLALTIDVGHLLCTGDLPVERVIREHAGRLRNVHLDDIRGTVHRHRMFGSGDLDLPAALAALREVGYDGVASVELSRDSPGGPEAAREAIEHLRRALAPPG